MIARHGQFPERLPTCQHCNEAKATCVGMYDNMTELAFACDECCGHGCEDGKCYELASAGEVVP